MFLAVLAALLAGLSVALCWAAPRVRSGSALADPPLGGRSGDASALQRHRLLLGALAAAGGLSFVGGPWGWGVGAALFVAVWVAAERSEPPGVRREREEVRRDLPHVVQLLGIALGSGASVTSALQQVSAALPGAASEGPRLANARLALGVPPEQVWSELASQRGLEPLGRALSRADSSGVRVVDAVRRLGAELARERRLEVEDRARTVGIRAALPLGLCLLPSFLMVGIVPVIAAALDSLQW
jgi:Flp pilus assembly protein TadB